MKDLDWKIETTGSFTQCKQIIYMITNPVDLTIVRDGTNWWKLSDVVKSYLRFDLQRSNMYISWTTPQRNYPHPKLPRSRRFRVPFANKI